MIVNNTDLFRKNELKEYLDNHHLDRKTSLYKIIINLIDRCNRTCNFCPRGNGYNFNANPVSLEKSTLVRICESLGTQFFGTISFGGFGEPTLLQDINEYVMIVKDLCPKSKVSITTNGYSILNISQNYLIDRVEFSVYNGICTDLQKIISQSPVKFYIKDQLKALDYYHNRGGNSKVSSEYSLPRKKCCNFPFYKMFIDTNGNVLLCCSDWNRKVVIGNVLEQDIYDIWEKNYRKIRMELINCNRSTMICQKCSMDGELAGKQFVSFWRNYYGKYN